MIRIAYAVFGILFCWATSSWAASIGDDSFISVARIIVFPEDGSGGLSAADAIQFNTGFTFTAFFGYVACYVRCVMELFK
jgi:hypothetical protein